SRSSSPARSPPRRWRPRPGQRGRPTPSQAPRRATPRTPDRPGAVRGPSAGPTRDASAGADCGARAGPVRGVRLRAHVPPRVQGGPVGGWPDRADGPIGRHSSALQVPLRGTGVMAGTLMEDHVLLSDQRATALVTRGGTRDWLCMPRFDAAAVFCSLLGDESHGHWTLRIADGEMVGRRYLPSAMVLETTWRSPTGTATVTDFMSVEPDDPSSLRGDIGAYSNLI